MSHRFFGIVSVSKLASQRLAALSSSSLASVFLARVANVLVGNRVQDASSVILVIVARRTTCSILFPFRMSTTTESDVSRTLLEWLSCQNGCPWTQLLSMTSGMRAQLFLLPCDHNLTFSCRFIHNTVTSQSLRTLYLTPVTIVHHSNSRDPKIPLSSKGTVQLH